MKYLLILSLLTLGACSTLTPLQVAKLRIDDKIKDHQDDFRKCYDDQYTANDKKAEGTVQIWFIVDLDGSVSRQSLKSTTLNNTIVEQCLMRTLSNLSFDANLDEKPVEVVYPFKFKKDSAEK